MTADQPHDILLVEDNPDTVEFTEMALAPHNLADRLIVARDGAEALELLIGEHAHTFAFVILDLKLPKISGDEVLRRIRADPRTRTLPVVVLSASDHNDDILTAYNNGANSYVRKPVSYDEFTTTVAQLGSYWAVLNAVPDQASMAVPTEPV